MPHRQDLFFFESENGGAIALTAKIIAFKIRPWFRDYGKIQDYAGETWLTIKQDLLQTLLDQPDWGMQTFQVDIFLHT